MSNVEVVDQFGQPTGEIVSREECLSRGLLRRTVWIMFFCKHRGILFQKRGPDKLIFPNLWDITVGGHVDIGETPLQAAVREVHEELGIKLSEENFIFQAMFADRIDLPKGMINNELGYTYLIDWTDKESNFHLQSEEVVEMRWFTFHELEEKFFGKNWPIDFSPHKKAFSYILCCARQNL